MGHQREFEFARIQGLLFKHKIPEMDRCFETINLLKAEPGNLKAEQITLIERLVEQAMEAKAKVVKEAVINAINGLKL